MKEEKRFETDQQARIYFGFSGVLSGGAGWVRAGQAVWWRAVAAGGDANLRDQ
jgi:hypothetical protein